MGKEQKGDSKDARALPCVTLASVFTQTMSEGKTLGLDMGWRTSRTKCLTLCPRSEIGHHPRYASSAHRSLQLSRLTALYLLLFSLILSAPHTVAAPPPRP